MTDEENLAVGVPSLIAMIRDQPQFPGGPLTADVHPDEVDNFRCGGWRLTDEDASGDPVVALDAMKFGEIKAYAVEAGIAIKPGASRESLIAAIRAKSADIVVQPDNISQTSRAD